MIQIDFCIDSPFAACYFTDVMQPDVNSGEYPVPF